MIQGLFVHKVHDARYEVQERNGTVRAVIARGGTLWRVEGIHQPGTGCAAPGYALWRAFIAGTFRGDLTIRSPDEAEMMVNTANEKFHHNQRIAR